MKVQYINWSPRPDTLATIEECNDIIEQYAEMGLSLTLRQLYYRLFATGKIAENTQEQYDRVGRIVGMGRKAGMIDWDAIVDRTRGIRGKPYWKGPIGVLHSARSAFSLDKWADQRWRLECWVEKDALVDVISVPCRKLDVPYTSCRGYTSQTEIKAASDRLSSYIDARQGVVIIHLADHDPSGIDMSRDVLDRVSFYMERGHLLHVERIALNYDQVNEHKPPPAWAKVKDSRYKSYSKEFGRESWELDALPPETIIKLIEDEILIHRDEEVWSRSKEREAEMRADLDGVIGHAERWLDQ